MRVALLSGGKDSLYAAMQAWPPDLGLFLHYGWQPPSPHVVNVGASISSLLSTGLSVVVYRSVGSGWVDRLTGLLERLGVNEIVAGDVYVEDHLRFWEQVADRVGARLQEPLWGMDPEELVYKIFESGVRSLVIGVQAPAPPSLLGQTIDSTSVHLLVEEARRGGWDPLGEHGEYHTLVVDSPVHKKNLNVKPCGRISGERWTILRVCSEPSRQ